MARTAGSFELALNQRSEGQTLTSWLYSEMRAAILDGRLRSATRLPASRDFALQHDISRGKVVSVLERLQAEGYISCRVGSGTVVNPVQDFHPTRNATARSPDYIRRVISEYARPKLFVGLMPMEADRPFSMRDRLWRSSPPACGAASRRDVHGTPRHGCEWRMTDVDTARCVKQSQATWLRTAEYDALLTR